MTDHIVKDIRVSGEGDRDTTIVSFNDQAFAFTHERLEEFCKRMSDRLYFLRQLKKVKG